MDIDSQIRLLTRSKISSDIDKPLIQGLMGKDLNLLVRGTVIKLLNQNSIIVENFEGKKFLINDATGLKLGDQVEINFSAEKSIGILTSGILKPQLINILKYQNNPALKQPEDIVILDQEIQNESVMLLSGKLSYIDPSFSKHVGITPKSILHFYISAQDVNLKAKSLYQRADKTNTSIVSESRTRNFFAQNINKILNIILPNNIKNQKIVSAKQDILSNNIPKSLLHEIYGKVVRISEKESTIKTPLGTISIEGKIHFKEGQEIKLLFAGMQEPSLEQNFDIKIEQLANNIKDNWQFLQKYASLISKSSDFKAISKIFIPAYDNKKIAELIHKAGSKIFSIEDLDSWLDTELDKGIIGCKNSEILAKVTKSYMDVLEKNFDTDSTTKVVIPFYLKDKVVYLKTNVENNHDSHREIYFSIDITPEICDLTLEGWVNYTNTNRIGKIDLQIVSTTDIPLALEEAIVTTVTRFSSVTKIPTIINFMVY